MSDQYPFFAYLSRMRYINRWGDAQHLSENIQEHYTGGGAGPRWP
ncbi:MAG: YfbR-like 5'-deoxynucleotidase [Flavonifractor plautii]